MKIEHFYYDEQEKWFAQMKAAMEKHDAELSKEERTLEQKKSDMELQNIIQNAEREEKETYRMLEQVCLSGFYKSSYDIEKLYTEQKRQDKNNDSKFRRDGKTD